LAIVSGMPRAGKSIGTEEEGLKLEGVFVGLVGAALAAAMSGLPDRITC
jgi:hypothetical protein